jgi:serine/threonine protein kinase
MNAKPLESEPEDRPKGGARFTYPSGSQPLDGYTIKRGVGRGGFGEVYYAVSDAGKEVALKLIRRNLDVELRGVTHCLNLKHPNLVALYDIKTDDNDDRWVVMEYVSGESLEDAIDRHPNGMPAEMAIEWFSGIAAGVAYLHDHGIVHRDLKPANIFLDEGTVKIGDYGLSKFISCSRRSGQTESVGTVHYMAPEIANGRYGREIDTYALGIILYEMLTGHVPFEGESVGEVLMKHLTAEPDLSAVGEPYRGIVQGAMAKDPETRIRSVAEMLNSLGVGNPASVIGNVAPSYSHLDTTIAHNSAEGAASWSPKPFGRFPPQDGGPRDNGSPRDQVPPHESTPVEEPIAAAFHQGWQTLKQAYHENPLPSFLKAVILIAICFTALRTIQIWFPIATTCLIAYFVYRAVWTVIVKPATPRQSKFHRGATYPPGSNPAASGQPSMVPFALADATPVSKKEAQRRRKRSTQRQLQAYLSAKPMHDRLVELVGSMFIAAVVSIVAALVVCLIADPFSKELFAWLSTVGSLSCWAIMIPAKLAEGKVEDQAPLRFIQLLSGAVVGVLAWAIADWLMLPLLQWNSMGIWANDGLMSNTVGLAAFGRNQYSTESIHLPLPMFAAYFAFLFVLIAWWEQTESTRSTRVNIWSIAWCGLVAWLLHFIWWFPQPLGMLLAAVMAFTLQFASPWLSPSKRRAILDSADQGVV